MFGCFFGEYSNVSEKKLIFTSFYNVDVMIRKYFSGEFPSIPSFLIPVMNSFCEVSSNSVHIRKSYSSTTGCFYLFIRLQYGGQFRNFTPESQRLKRPLETCRAGYLLMFCEVSSNSVHI